MDDEKSNARSDIIICLMRHGDAAIDPDYYGRHDTMPLSTVGRNQARNAAESLRDIEFKRLIVSPLERSVETAAAITQATGLEPEFDERFAERVHKPFFGLSYTQIANDYGREVSDALKNGESDSVKLDGFESLKECQDRTWNAICDIFRRGIGPVLVVAHGGPHEWLAKSILNIRDWSKPTRQFSLDKCGISVFSFSRDEKCCGRIVRLNVPLQPGVKLI